MGEISKIQAFEYLVHKLIEWHKSSTGSSENDLSILKVLKLTFFVSAVGTKKDSTNTLLDDVFNNYVAMPYGHVESDVYSYIKNNQIVNVSIDNQKSEQLESFKLSSYNKSLKDKIDNSINLLKETNKNLIKLSSFDLVDLSHSWYSWQHYFNLGKKNHSFSTQIPIEEIKKEDKIYQI